ncbi:hypothetical protein WA158_007996 [Blastocystis sp. Blastoise]
MQTPKESTTITMDREDLRLLKSQMNNLQFSYNKFTEDLISFCKENSKKMNDAFASMNTLFGKIEKSNGLTISPLDPKMNSVPTANAMSATSYVFTFRGSPKKYVVDVDLLEKFPNCLFYVLCQDSKSLNEKGEIFIDHEDTYLPQIFDFMVGNDIKLSQKRESELITLHDEFLFFNLPFPEYLDDVRFKLAKEREWLWDKKVDINGKVYKITNYDLKERNITNSFFQKPIDDNVDYDEFSHVFTVLKYYKYFDYVYQYITTGDIQLSDSVKSNIDFIKLEKEFEDLGIERSSTLMKKYWYSFAFSDSLILTNETSSILNRWLDGNKSWKLLYRGSQDGFTGKIFHDKCDNQGETVTIIRNNDYGHKYIFGGYTSCSWCTSGKWEYDPKAFIFTLQNPLHHPAIKFNTSDPSNSLYCNESCGPSFGLGCDLYVSDKCNEVRYNYIHFSYGYGPDTTKQGWKLFLEDKGEDSYYFTVDEIEVYGIA